jgi:aryl-alcohol dehydrogenase-like predicted oxidoreductase
MRARVHACLRRLRTDFVDVFHLHALAEPDYDYAVCELVPVLRSLRDEGKIRHLGMTERYGREPDHRTLRRALADPWFDAVMVGFSIVNQSARQRVFAETRRLGIGTLCMFAVRRALSEPAALRELIALLVERGQVDAGDFDMGDPLGFITDGPAQTIPEAAYRFARWEPGLDVILSGTGSLEHLQENVRSLSSPPLPDDVAERLRTMFARVDCVSGN